MRLLIGLIAFIFMIVGETFLILYFNLFTFGYTIKEYLSFIFSKIECYLFFIGLIMEIILLRKGNRR